MSLYRKYRPQNFANLVGQDHVRQTLLNEIKNSRVSHAYLFAGPRGTGKTTTARLIAKALNCTNINEEGEPCDECEFCRLIAEGSLIDVIEIDAASNRGIDEIRDLREKIKFAPTRTKHKVYIIDEVHMLTKEAFNALLKTLEEPPPNVFFILATTEVHKIPETIISRCQRFDFKRINIKTLMTRLQYIAQKEKIEAEDKAIELIARYVGGGLRDAISLLEQMAFEQKLTYEHVRAHLGVTGHKTIEDLYQLLLAKDYKKALHLVQQVHNEGYDLDSFLREMLEYLREELMNEVELEKKEYTPEILRMIEIFLEAKEGLKRTPIPQLPLEIALIKICALEQPSTKSTAQLFPKTKKEPDKETEILNKLMQETGADTAEQKTADTIKKEFEVKESALDRIEINLPTAEEHWPRVLEAIEPPSLRRSLREGKIISIDEREVTVGFGSRFHLEKIKTVEHTDVIEQTLQKIFGKPIKLVCTLQKVSLREKEETYTQPADITAKALEIFGGEEV